MTDERETLLEKIIYECVGLSDIMRSGIPNGETIYNEILAKHGAKVEPTQEEYDDMMNRQAYEMLYGDEEEFDDDESNEWENSDYFTCGCIFCHCTNMTLGGGICTDCSEGAHQG